MNFTTAAIAASVPPNPVVDDESFILVFLRGSRPAHLSAAAARAALNAPCRGRGARIRRNLHDRSAVRRAYSRAPAFLLLAPAKLGA